MDNATGFSTTSTVIQFNNTTINNSQGIHLEALLLDQVQATIYSRLTFNATYLDTVSGAHFVTGGGMRMALQDTDAIRFLFSSGNISNGKYAVYGLI
jgi:phosphoribosylaminoimidazole (AIR) synthetase